MIVVDANVLAYYLVEGKRTMEANALRQRDAEWIVPAFWCVEFQAVLWKYVRIGGMPMDKALELLDDAMGMLSANELTPSPDIVLRDALDWGISVYDAQYASLARHLGIRCVTEDAALQKALPRIAVSMAKFLGSRESPPGMRESPGAYRSRRNRQERTSAGKNG
jgi:predicted nucleic acid-binding protein